MKSSDIVIFDITEEELYYALEKSLKHKFIDNLRDRDEFVQLDSKIRGYLGELLIFRILKENDINIVSTNSSLDNINDIDILVDNGISENIKLEVKTSLIPDSWKSLDNVLKLGDIKIIKREDDFNEMKSDFHIQIYFNQFRKARDNYLKKIEGSIREYSKKELIKVMKLRSLKQSFVAFMDKRTLIKRLNRLSKDQTTWHFSFRDFWVCKIRDSKPFKDFVTSIKKYKK